MHFHRVEAGQKGKQVFPDGMDLLGTNEWQFVRTYANHDKPFRVDVVFHRWGRLGVVGGLGAKDNIKLRQFCLPTSAALRGDSSFSRNGVPSQDRIYLVPNIM